MSRSKKEKQKTAVDEAVEKALRILARQGLLEVNVDGMREREVLRRYGFGETWLRISRRKLREGVQGAGPAFSQSGHIVIYHRRDIEEWLKTHRVDGTTKAKTPRRSSPPETPQDSGQN
jgi:hypothetical protein